MISTRFVVLALCLATPGVALAQAEEQGKAFNPRLLRRFQPLRASLHETPASAEQIALGKMLYFDKRLSKTGDVSCQSCHAVEKYGVDGQAFSKGTKGQRGGRNAPSTYNAAGHFVQFWDGRAATVEAQATGPMLNAAEMGMEGPEAILKVLNGIPDYGKHFAAAFPGSQPAVSIENVGKAIGAFERTLVTPSRWDRYLTGDKSALTAAEVEGLRVFTNVGCMVCHTGEMLGGSMYQRAGVVEPWPNQKDNGRQALTNNPADQMVFKVPSLRNVAMTAPYFHDGSAKDLDEAVAMMGRHQLGLELSSEEITSIATWLKSLTGTLPKAALVAPVLPKGPK